MEQIVVAVDFSRGSKGVVEQAVRMAERFAARLTLLHVAAPDPDFVGYGAGPQSVRDARAHELRDEHRELQGLAEAVRDTGVDARALLVEGPTVGTILAEMKKLRADLLVVGSHGGGALYRSLVGSVSEGLLRQAECPILVIPTRGL